jgi:hypothetical protein
MRVGGRQEEEESSTMLARLMVMMATMTKAMAIDQSWALSESPEALEEAGTKRESRMDSTIVVSMFASAMKLMMGAGACSAIPWVDGERQSKKG